MAQNKAVPRLVAAACSFPFDRDDESPFVGLLQVEAE